MRTRPGITPSDTSETEPDTEPQKPGIFRFPDNFLWGVATSHFQIEGHPDEMSNQLSDWAAWAGQDGKILDCSNASRACDFFTRYKQDIDLCKGLNMNSFRMSLNWPALHPTREECLSPDNPTIAYYKDVLKTLKAQGFKTFVTLFHFCLPRWLSEIGGWNNPLTIEEFEKFTRRAMEEFGEYVDYWVTINEPLAYAYQGYICGIWPPGYTGNYGRAFEAIRGMLTGHSLAYKEIHRQKPDAKVSFTLHWIPFYPRNKYSPMDRLVTYLRDVVFNHIFMQAIQTGRLNFPWPLNLEAPLKKLSGPIAGLKDSIDFLGINYYTRQICEFEPSWPPDLFGKQSNIVENEQSGLGWEIYPQGLYDLLTEGLRPYRTDSKGRLREIFITENGLANIYSAELSDGDWSLDDDVRARYLVSHLVAMHRAIAAGANVKGYLHWSLLDNFEWAEGLRARFGLVRVAYPTLERQARNSALLYADIARQNGVTDENNHT